MKRIFLLAVALCVWSAAFAQTYSSQEKKRFDVFVYADASVKTPLNALRSRLTHALINDTSLIVNDRSDEILAYIRSELEYTESGRVREDQLIKIGQHFGATTLCVVSVTHYAEYNEYFFEGVIVDITSRTIIKHCMYPDGSHLSWEEVIRIGDIEKTYHSDNYTKIQDLSPQTQLMVGNEIAKRMGLSHMIEGVLYYKDTIRVKIRANKNYKPK
ncbi:MAG: hypothetical protein IK103_00675 [Bacteroidales bacterium]|nr:hypothetical protein [Bacteroidales bacterium]